jgi:hypothetical protein
VGPTVSDGRRVGGASAGWWGGQPVITGIGPGGSEPRSQLAGGLSVSSRAGGRVRGHRPRPPRGRAARFGSFRRTNRRR